LARFATVSMMDATGQQRNDAFVAAFTRTSPRQAIRMRRR
jgi:hypothetical protein